VNPLAGTTGAASPVALNSVVETRASTSTIVQ